MCCHLYNTRCVSSKSHSKPAKKNVWPNKTCPSSLAYSWNQLLVLVFLIGLNSKQAGYNWLITDKTKISMPLFAAPET